MQVQDSSVLAEREPGSLYREASIGVSRKRSPGAIGGMSSRGLDGGVPISGGSARDETVSAAYETVTLRNPGKRFRSAAS